MSDPSIPADPSQLPLRLASRPRLNTTLPVTQSLRSTYVSLFNFPPSDFNFYQQPPPETPDPLTHNLLRGSFHLDPDSSLSVTHLKIAGGSSATTLPALTAEFWVNVSTNTSSSAYLFNYSDGQASLKLSNPNSLQIQIPGASFTSTVSIADGQWHHIAVVVDPQKRVLLYVDTRLVPAPGAPTFSTMLKDGGTLVVANSSVGGSNGIDGYIGQVRLWNSARTLPQIIMAAGAPFASESLPDLRLYWGDQVDVAGCRAIDLSLGHNEGVVTLGSQAPSPWWDTTLTYGALEDQAHLSAHPVNLTGNIRLDRTRLQAVNCSSNHLQLDSSATALTFEFWIKPDSISDTSEMMIVGLQLASQSGNTSELLKIINPRALAVTWNTASFETSVNLCDGHWHHIALVWDWASGTGADPDNPQWKLYQDTRLVATHKSTGTPSIGTTPHLILGGDGSDKDEKYFSGCLAEFRLWQSARSASDVLDDASYRLATPPPQLRLYWPFARDFRTDNVVEDFTSYHSIGRPVHSPDWENDLLFGVYANHLVIPPTPSPTSGAGEPMTTWNPTDVSRESDDGLLDGAAAGFPRVTQEALQSAFTLAQATGFFDARYFPNIRVKTARDHDAAKAALANLRWDVFLEYWMMGRRLDLVKRKHGHFAYRFIPAPLDAPTARLMLVETYRLSAYLGDVGTGPIVRTLTLMPGENASFSVSTFKETTTTAETASSIFDSYNESSQQSFAQSLGTDESSETSEAAELDFYADAEVKQRWGTGNADVSAGLNASGKISHANFYQQTTNAVLSHAAEASSARNVEVNTTYSVQEQENRQTSLSREVRNINSGRTLDLIFRQVVQEYLTVLHLVDIRVGYYDPNPGSFRVVALSELDALLAEVLIDNADLRLAYKQTIINEVYGIVAQCRGTALVPLVNCRDKTTGDTIKTPDLANITADQAFYIDAESYTNYQFPFHDGVVLRVPGVVMAHTAVVMRTDNVIAEAWVGEGVGLDAYSTTLQAEQLQRQRWENQLREAEAARLAQANAIVAAGDQSKANLYAQIFPAPRINNNVLYADETGARPPA